MDSDEEIELKNGMSLEDFRKYCAAHDKNVSTTWDYEKFRIRCLYCGSEDVRMVDDLEYHEGSGCPTCGFDSYITGVIIIKCLLCGTGMQVVKDDAFGR